MNEQTLKDRVTALAEKSKEELVNNEFTPSMVFYADDNPRVFVVPNMAADNARGLLAFSTKVLASSIDNLQEICWLMDSYVSKSKTKTNGERWEQGEMQLAVENQTEDAHLVTDSLGLLIINAEGQLGSANIKYKIEDGEVVFDWDDAEMYIQDSDTGDGAYGFFPDMLREAVSQQKLDHVLLELMKSKGLAPAREIATASFRRVHTLCAGVRHVMAEVGTTVNIVLPAYTEYEAEQFSKLDGENLRSFSEKDLKEIADLEAALKGEDA